MRHIEPRAGMRLLPLAILFACASVPTRDPALSETAAQLLTLPDSTAVMRRASSTERAHLVDRGADFTSSPPSSTGTVVEVLHDRLAIQMADDSTIPTEGSFLAVYDRTGIKAEAYVVRVHGRLVFTQFRLLGSNGTPAIGDRATCAVR